MKKYPKKTVKWKQDDELESVQYFEVDVSERSKYFSLSLFSVIVYACICRR